MTRIKVKYHKNKQKVEVRTGLAVSFERYKEAVMGCFKVINETLEFLSERRKSGL